MTAGFRYDGRAVVAGGSPMTPLVDVLRDVVGDTSPKPGCREGRCGACAVLVDGEPVVSCLVPVGLCDGRTVDTARTLATDPVMSLIMSRFADLGAVQCGICTPGMVVSTYVLLRDNPGATENDIREALVNNLCRCTGYRKIIDAIQAAQRELAERQPSGQVPNA